MLISTLVKQKVPSCDVFRGVTWLLQAEVIVERGINNK